jgi:methyltransferase
MMTAFFLLWSFVIVQRLSELALSHRNARWMRARGAVEAGKRHYGFAVVLHTAFLASLLIEVVMLNRHAAAWWWIPFSAFVLAQGLRYWCIATLGRFWNTRILVLPGASVVRRGPYRFLRHPNYLAVIIEFIAIPLVFQAYLTALVFSLLNALFLFVRIPAEENALSELTDYDGAFSEKGDLKQTGSER